MAEANRFAWTTGGATKLLHRRWIGTGGSGVVHELYNDETKQVFARKLLRLAQPDPKTARNELRAIKKLCNGTHKHIIKVFEFGDLPDSSHAYIDMELCSLNLDQYNQSIRATILVHHSVRDTRVGEIWSIVGQIADGLAFIHQQREIHRDLKPQNVLYSSVDRVWKVADFGLTSEGASQTLHNTEYARGTPGYRAPELLKEDQAVYNNKVDIWALGCILYELVVGAKPFPSDLAVLEHYRLMTPLNASFDETIDPDSAPILSKSIHEMLQRDPSSRPTAGAVLETFSIHDLATNMKHIHTQRSEEAVTNPMGAPPTEVAGPLPIFRQLPNPERVMHPERVKNPAVFPVVEERECIVVSTIINPSRARIATVSCDSDLEYSQVTLWDASTGDNVWRRQYPWTGIHSRADPAFSSDGKYFGIHHGDKAVEILDAQSATPVNTLAIESEGRITAIAIFKNGKRAAVAMSTESLDVPTATTDSATLNDHVNSNVDVVQTLALTGMSLAYDLRGRYLFLVSTSTKPVGHRQYATFSFSWDLITRSAARVSTREGRGAGPWTTPLYNLPSNRFATFRGCFTLGRSYLEVFNTTDVSGPVLSFESYSACSFNNHSVLVLGNEARYQVWVRGRGGAWIKKQNLEPSDSSDETVYKYLVMAEGKTLDGVAKDVKFVAKIAWDNMPPLTDVKGFVETDAGLTFMLEGEKFIFLSKEA